MAVLDAGIGMITDRLKNGASGAYTAEPSYIEWGTGTTAVNVATDSDIETSRAEARVNGTTSLQTTNTTNDTYRSVGTITIGSGTDIAITEVGQFDDLSAGDMFSRNVFAAVTVSTGESITFTIDTVFDQA